MSPWLRGAGVIVTDIVLQPGVEAVHGDDAHLEDRLIHRGRGVIRDHAGDPERRITPGSLWIAERGDRSTAAASRPTRLVCVFTPPFASEKTGFAGDQRSTRGVASAPGAR